MKDEVDRNVCVAHDLKGLATRARLAVDLLERHEDEPVRRQAERITRALEKMMQICLAEFGAPKEQAAPKRHDAHELTNLLHEVFAIARAKSGGLSKLPHLSVQRDVSVTVDPLSLLRILNNLISGASTTWGDDDKSAMVLRVTQKGSEVVFDLTRVPDFDISQDATLCDPTQIGRIGAGLISALRLAQELGGDVFMLNTLDQLAAFRLRLPSAPAEPVNSLTLNTKSGAHNARAALHPAE